MEVVNASRSIRVLDDYLLHFLSFVQEGGEGAFYNGIAHFDNPGNVYSSSKHIINAYTDQIKIGKKLEDLPVTIRTAGIHLHFTLSPAIVGYSWAKDYASDIKKLNDLIFNWGNRTHLNNLVKMLDQIYHGLIIEGLPMNPRRSQREEKYQILGDYRIKDGSANKSGNPSLEYRQLDSGLYTNDWSTIQKMIDIFQYEAIKYLKQFIA